MSTATTIYDVKIRYITEDQSSSTLGGIAKQADQASRSTGALGSALTALGGIATMGAVTSLFKKIVGVGSEAEDTKIAIAGMMQAGGAGGLGQGADQFNRAMTMSGDMIAKMRVDARELPGEFEDLVNVFRGGLMGGTQAGKSPQEIEALSARMMAVSKTLQIDSETAGREFAMMMEGRAGAHNTLFQRLHGQIGMAGEEFNKLAAPQKWALIDRALKGYDPAIKAFGDTWSATESTLRDFIKDAFRLASGPVFKLIGDEVKGWNDWLVKNDKTVKEIVKSVGEGMVEGFRTVKDIVRFIVDHSSELKFIAEAYIGISAMGSVASGIGRLGSVVEGLSSLSLASATTAQGFAGLAGKLGGTVAALGLFALTLQYIAEQVDKHQKRSVAEEGDRLAMMQGFLSSKSFETTWGLAAQFAKRFNAITPEGELDKNKYQIGLNTMGFMADEQATLLDRAQKVFAAQDEYEKRKLTGMVPDFRNVGDANPALSQKLKNPATVNVTINKIEVSSDDPDRFMVGLVTAAERAVSNPTQARGVFHRAF